MLRSVSLLCLTAVLAVVSSVSAQSVTTDPVGFITLNVYGPASTGGSALTFLGVGFTQPVSYQATLASAAGTTLTDSSAAFSGSPFSGANGNYYIELTSGTGAGRTSQITGTPTATTITTADNLSSFVSAGTGYKIRKNWTIADFFGAGGTLVLTGGTSGTADEVLIYRPTATPSPKYDVYYYKNAGIIGGTGWRSTNDLSADASTTPLLPTDGILVRRHTAGNVSFALAGAVKLGQTQLGVTPGLNILSNVYPAGTFTLGNSGLLASGLTGGTSGSADQVLIYNPTALPSPKYDVYYYKNAGIIGGTGWRSTDDLSADASATAIPFGASILIQRINPGAFAWVAPQPF